MVTEQREIVKAIKKTCKDLELLRIAVEQDDVDWIAQEAAAFCENIEVVVALVNGRYAE